MEIFFIAFITQGLTFKGCFEHSGVGCLKAIFGKIRNFPKFATIIRFFLIIVIKIIEGVIRSVYY